MSDDDDTGNGHILPEEMRLLIKEWCVFKGIGQNQLAERAGLDKALVSRLANNRKEWHPTHVMQLTRALGIPWWWLLRYNPLKGESLLVLLDEADEDDRAQLAPMIRAYLDARKKTQS